MSDNASAFIVATVKWLNESVVRPGVVLDARTPLFEGGLIDSIRVLELIAWTENAIGAEIPDARIRMDNFRTVTRIAEVFVHEVSDAAA